MERVNLQCCLSQEKIRDYTYEPSQGNVLMSVKKKCKQKDNGHQWRKGKAPVCYWMTGPITL